MEVKDKYMYLGALEPSELKALQEENKRLRSFLEYLEAYLVMADFEDKEIAKHCYNTVKQALSEGRE